MIDVSETIYQNRMTQASLARLLNKGRAHIWRWANNKSGLSALNDEKLRKALKENGLVVVEKKEKLVFCGCGAEMGWLEEEWGVCQDCK